MYRTPILVPVLRRYPAAFKVFFTREGESLAVALDLGGDGDVVDAVGCKAVLKVLLCLFPLFERGAVRHAHVKRGEDHAEKDSFEHKKVREVSREAYDWDKCQTWRS